MLSKLIIENFKALKNVNLEFKKLNLIFGINSSGKSSVIQLLSLLSQSIETGKLEIRGKLIDLGDLRDLIYKRGEDFLVGFEIEPRNLKVFKEEKISFNKIFKEFNKFTFITKINNRSEWIRKKLIINNESIFDISYKNNQIIDNPTLFKQKYENIFSNLNIFNVSTGTRVFEMPYLSPIATSELARVFGDINQYIFKELNEIMMVELQLFYPIFVNRGFYQFNIQCESVVPSLSYAIRENLSKLEKTLINLLFIIKSNPSEYPEWFEKINFWSKKIFNVELNTKYLHNVSIELLTKDNITNFLSNILHYGFGYNQFLAILIPLIILPLSSIIVIEEPEIHLHPKAQSDIMDLFIEISKQKQIIITTHSEHLLFRLQRRIAENQINNEDVRIYYFNKTKNGVEARLIKLDEKGRFEKDFPDFFSNDVKEMEAYSKALLKGKDD